jgi:hypothetical protein
MNLMIGCFVQRNSLTLFLCDQQQQQEELKYKQLNDEIQSLSHELALSPRGSHASPMLSLKAMKLLGMVNLDVTSAGRWNQDVDYDLETPDDLAGGSSPPTQSSPSSSSSTATRSKPAPNNNTAVPLKAMKMLGVMEGAGSSTSGKKSRSVIHRGGDRGPSTAAAASAPLSNSGNHGQVASDDESTSPEPVLSPLAMLLDWKGRRGRSNSKEVSLLDSLTSSSSSESEASPHTVRVRRARTLSKEELTDSSIVQDRDVLDRRERRARTLSKGI